MYICTSTVVSAFGTCATRSMSNIQPVMNYKKADALQRMLSTTFRMLILIDDVYEYQHHRNLFEDWCSTCSRHFAGFSPDL